ncbi:MAG TPA: hypothetical protein VFI93_03640 [Rhizomicrobium sp.]|nr:hypothetical protein [Rhizomicrobium sp.]
MRKMQSRWSSKSGKAKPRADRLRVGKPGFGKPANSNKPPKPRKPDADRDKAKRAALAALRKARAKAEKAEVDLSEWEGEFLGSVEERLEQYGRAFADPELGPQSASLSLRQTAKVKEIAAKAKREAKAEARRKAKPGDAKQSWKRGSSFRNKRKVTD